MVSICSNKDAPEDRRFISTGCKRMDQLIGQYGKGFEYREGRPISILIKGEPGVGKSTLSVQMADAYISSVAESNELACCIYFSLDEEPDSVKTRLQSLFGPELPYRIETIEYIKQLFGIETFDDIEEMDAAHVAKIKQEIQQIDIMIGSLGYSIDYTLNTESEILYRLFEKKIELINRWLEFFAGNFAGTNLVIVDSLNALRGQMSSRALLSMFFHLVKLDGYNSIFVLESDQDAQVEEYLVDAVIELGFSEDALTPRFLKICKARDHDIIPVENYMIINRNGIMGYPHIQSILKSPHFGLIPELPDGMMNCFFDIPGLDRELHSPPIGDRIERGIERGSTTLLLGHEGTGKSYLSLRFLNQGFFMGERVLYISLGTTRSSVLNTARLVHGLDVAIEHKEFPERTMNPAEFIDRVYQAVFAGDGDIHEGISSGRISRVAIDDLGVLSLNYSQDELVQVLRTLVGIFKKAKVTSIITYSSSDIFGHSNLDMIVDNIITTSYIKQESLAREHIGICIRRFGGATTQCKLQELEYSPGEKEFSVHSGIFKDLIELPGGKMSLGKLKIHYFAGETSALETLANELKSSISDVFLGNRDEKPIFDYFGEAAMKHRGRIFSRKAFLKGLLSRLPFSGTTDSRIVMFDEPWAPVLEKELIKIREIDESYLKLFEGDTQVFQGFPYPILSQVTSGNKVNNIFGIPLYANFSHLCYRKDLIKHYYGSSPILQDYFDDHGEIKEDHVLSWAEIFRICGHVVGLEAEKSNVDRICKNPANLLEFYFGLDEPSLASFFLELVWPIIFQGPETSDIQIKNLPALAPDMIKWLNLVQAGWDKLKELDMIEEFDFIQGEFDFVFGRLWYAISASIEHESSVEYGYCRVPSLRDHHPGTCISGNWYFGVLKGSANPHRALNTILQMTNKSVNNDIFHTKAALPTHTFYWDGQLNTEFIPKKITELYREAKSRCQIANFHQISSVLASGFTKLLNTQTSSAAITDILKIMQLEVDSLARNN